MKPILRRQIHPEATSPSDTAAPIIEFRSSDETLDRYKERITVAGWKLDNYRKNPVVQNAHNNCSVSDTIGKSLITEIRSAPAPYLFQRILFAVAENPMAKIAYGLYKGGFLTAVSVGFIPITWENGGQEEGYRRKYIQQELIEVSAVSIPANPNALELGLKSGAIEIADLKELFQLLKHFCTAGSAGVPPASITLSSSDEERAGVRSRSSDLSTQNSINSQNFRNEMAARGSITSALGPASNEARLLQLKKQMDEIRAVIRRG